MPNATISIPKQTDIETIFAFGIELDRYSQHDRLIINLPEKAFFSPFTMLFIGSKIAHLRRRCPNLQVVFNGWDKHDYISHMGFFSLCGFDHGKALGEAYGSHQYLPITKLNSDMLIEKKLDEYEEMQDLLQRHVDRIATVLARNDDENHALYNVLSYSLREVFRNVFEHGDVKDLCFCAQYWPRSNKVEFAVSDYGIGVKKGLGRNPNFRFDTDKQALEYAMLPSVSGRTHQPRVSENWFNSGYGLYMTSRLARNGGNFVICSGSSAICLTPKTKSNLITSFPGTILRVKLDVNSIGDVQARLSEFREDGKKIAETIKGSGNRPPSAMSLLLRRDYRAGSTRR